MEKIILKLNVQEATLLQSLLNDEKTKGEEPYRIEINNILKKINKKLKNETCVKYAITAGGAIYGE